MLILTFNDSEEKAVEKVIAALADKIEFEVMRSAPSKYRKLCLSVIPE